MILGWIHYNWQKYLGLLEHVLKYLAERFGNIQNPAQFCYWIEILVWMHCHRFSTPASSLVSPSYRNISLIIKIFLKYGLRNILEYLEIPF